MNLHTQEWVEHLALPVTGGVMGAVYFDYEGLAQDLAPITEHLGEVEEGVLG